MSAKTRVLGTPPVHDGGKHVGEAVVTYQKNFQFSNKVHFEASLAVWLRRYVAQASVAPLMQQASGLQALLDFVARTPAPLNGQWTVTMHLMWDRLSNGQWYVEGVGFSINAGPQQLRFFNASKLREKLIDAAEARAARKGPAEWKAFFGLEHGSPNWLDDVQQGQKLIAAAMRKGHEAVKDVMPALQNPIGVDFSNFNNLKDGWEIAKAVLGTAAASVTKSKVTKGWDWIDRADKVVFNLIEQNPGKLAGDLLDFGLPFVFEEAGPVSALASTILGSFFNIAIASDAARISKARARLYLFFASGFVGRLAPEALEVPKIGKRRNQAAAMRLYMELGVYGLGEEIAGRATPREKYLMQLALLHYTATHNTTQAWNFGNHVNQNWKHPEDYTFHWSRELMLRSLTWQFSRLKYLTN